MSMLKTIVTVFSIMLLATLFPAIHAIAASSVTEPVWQASTGPEEGTFSAIAIDPGNNLIIYAGAGSGGVYKSTNGGASWRAINSGFAAECVRAFVIDPLNSQIIYAHTDINSALFKSINGGESWSAVSSTGNFAFAIDPMNSQTIYISKLKVNEIGLYKSTDGGGSWSAINNGIVPYYSNAIAIDPNNSNVIYVAQESALYKSVNGGSSWNAVASGNSIGSAKALVFDPVNSQTIYAATGYGLYKSVNGGTIWYEVDNGLQSAAYGIYALAIDKTNPQTIYLGANTVNPNDGGIFKSTNGGATWSAINSGLSNTYIESLAIDTASSQTVYAGTFAGMFKSTDRGSSWNAVSSSGLNASYISAVAFGRTSRAIYAAGSAGVYKTADSGATWNLLNSGLTNIGYGVRSLAINPNNDQILYAGKSGSVFKSNDGGLTWSGAHSGLPSSNAASSIVIDPINNQNIYAAYDYPGGVFKSSDGGLSWNTINNGLTSQGLRVMSLAIDPVNSTTIYAGTQDGVFKTDNGGTSWNAVSSGLTSFNFVPALAIDPNNNQTVYAGTYAGVFISHNGGASWAAANNGLTTLNTMSLIIHPSNSRVIYAGTYYGIVFKSTDGGTSWSPDGNSWLTGRLSWRPYVTSFVIDPYSNAIYAGTGGNGVFKGATGVVSGDLTLVMSNPDFGKVLPGDSNNLAITLKNQGSSLVTLGTLSLQDITSVFSIELDSCSGGQLAPNATCTVMIKFTPAAPQAYTSNLKIPFGNSQLTVPLKGNGSSSGSPTAYYTLYMTQGGAPNNSYIGSINGDNDFAGVSEMGYATSGEDTSIISHALYPVDYYTQKTSDRSGFISARTGVTDPDSTDTRQPLILIHGWQGDSSVASGFIDRDQRWLLEDAQLGEDYWNNFVQYFNKTPELNQRFRLYVYHYPSYKHVTFNARVLSKLIPRVGYINNWLAAGKKVTILGHSMGGLVSRSLIEEHDGVTVKKGDGSPLKVSGIDMLDKLVTTATPHHGSPASLYWWLKKEGYTSQLADFVKDLFSPGAQDLYWDNYDGIFDWAVGTPFSYTETGADINRIDFNNSGRRTENRSFDDYHRLNLLQLDSKANDAYSGKLTINSTSTLVYRYPNPWLSSLNTRFKQNKANYSSKYVFFGGYNDSNNASADNRLNDYFISDLAADARIYEVGYINDWVVPLTSSLLDFSKQSTGGLLSYNSTLFIDSGGKSALFPSWLTDSTKVELNSSVNGIPTRALKDYHHDRLLNGAYFSIPADLLDKGAQSGFLTDVAAQMYMEQSGVSYSAFQASKGDAVLQSDAKLLFEPLFNMFKRDLPGSAMMRWFADPVAEAGGTILPVSPVSIANGGTTQFTISANTDYMINTVTGCGGTLSGTTYTTGQITSDCTVTAKFKMDTSKCIRQMGNIIIRSTTCDSTTAYNTFSGTITLAYSLMPDNSLLKIDNGSLNLDSSFDRIDSPIGSSSSLYIPDVYGLGNVNLGWGVNFDVNDSIMTTPTDSSQVVMEGAQKIIDSLLGFNITLNSVTLSPNAVEINGKLSSSFLAKKYLKDSKDKSISIGAGLLLSQTDGLKVNSIELSASEVKFANSTLSDAVISIDTVKQRYKIGGQVSFSNLFKAAGIGGSMTFTGAFPYIDALTLVGSNINKPIGHPLVFLQKVEGSISGIVVPPFKGQLKASLSGGPKLPKSLANFKAFCANDLGFELDASSSFAGTGIFGALCLDSWESYKNGAINLNGKLEYNWRKSSYDADAEIITPYEIYRGKGNLHFGSDISGKSTGTLKMPKGAPMFGGVPLANQTVKFDNNGVMTSMAVLKGEIVTKMDWALFTDDIMNALNHIDVAVNWKEISKTTSKAVAQSSGKTVALAAGPSSVIVPSGLDTVIIRTTWHDGTSDVSLIAPDGTTISPVYAMAHPEKVVYTKLDKEAWYGIDIPAAGSWEVVIADAAAIGDYSVTVNSMIAKPTVSVTSPLSKIVSSTKVDIGYSATAPDSTSTISLYYDTTNSGETGVKIVDGLSVLSGAATYSWDVSAIPPGVYYVYAIINDGVNMPVASHAPGRIEITNSTAPATPAGFASSASGTSVTASWSAVSGATGYKIYYTDNATGELYQSTVSLPADVTSYSLNNLKPTTAYRLTITTYDTNLHESLMATPVTATTAAAPVPVIGTSVDSIDFGTVQVGQSSSKAITVSNSGTSDLVISSAIFSGANSPLLTLDTGVNLPLTIAAGGSATVSVNLDASGSGTVNTLLLLGSNDPATPKKSVAMAAFVPYQNYTVTYLAGSNGSIMGAASQAVVNSGSTTPVTAIADAGYHFVNWTGTNGFIIVTTNPLIVTNLSSSHAITAIFSADFIVTHHNGIVIGSGKAAPDISDALAVLKHFNGDSILDVTKQTNADVAPLGANGVPVGDGKIDLADVIIILRRAIGIGSW